MAFSDHHPSVISVDELERIAAAGWPGVETGRLGDWWLRAGHGFTGRANSALLIGDPGRPLADALSAVERFYLDRDLPAQLQVPELPGGTSAPARDLDSLNRTLDCQGWARHNAAWVMTAGLEHVLDTCRADSRLPEVLLEHAPSKRWLSGYQYRGSELPARAEQVIAAGENLVFASIVEGGELLGVARGAVSEGWLGITAVTVTPKHRRRGVARTLMGALVGWAAHQGVGSVYLQVDVANDVALRMYDRLGFARHHQYHYRRLAK